MSVASAADRIWRPYTQHGAMSEPIAVERAAGAYLYAKGGRKIFDAVSSWWVNLHGHGEPRIAAAIAEQARTLEHVIFAGFTHEPAERAAEALLKAAPRGLEHVFFSDDGSTAVEAALKMALGAWTHRGAPRTTIVALEHAYHGDTFGAMSVSARGAFTQAFERLLFSVERLPFPARGGEARTLEAFARLLERRGGEIAALIVEPLVLGAGGMLMYEPAVLAELAALCRRHGVFLIADEVMTGFGRTGTMFACEQAGVTPDILCVSKGITGGFLPLGATLASAEVFEAFRSSDRSKAFFHGHSYTANPVACAATVANLELFAREPVLDRVAAVGAAHERRLAGLARRPQVREVRRRGSIAAVELQAADAGYLSARGPRLYDFFLSRGVLLRPLGNVVYLLPPYCSTAQDLDLAYDAIEDSLELR